MLRPTAGVICASMNEIPRVARGGSRERGCSAGRHCYHQLGSEHQVTIGPLHPLRTWHRKSPHTLASTILLCFSNDFYSKSRF